MKGYVYILSNPCMKDDQLKIGRTTRTPEIRAKEISKGTGIPMPFEVIHFREFDNCFEAERLVHENLKEYRINADREFFQIPLVKAIKEVDNLAFAELKAKLVIAQKDRISEKNLFIDFRDTENSEQMEISFFANLKGEIIDKEDSWNSFLKYLNLLCIFENDITPPNKIHKEYNYEDISDNDYRYKDYNILFTHKNLETKDDLIKNKLSSLINQIRKDEDYYNNNNLKNGFVDNYLILNKNFGYFFEFKDLYKILHQTDFKIENAGTYKASLRKIADKIDISPKVLNLRELSAYQLIRKIGINERNAILDINELLSSYLFNIFLDYFKTIFKEGKDAALFLDNKYLSQIVFDIIVLGYDSEYISRKKKKYYFKYSNFTYELDTKRLGDLIESKKMINNSCDFNKINAKEMVLNFLEWHYYDFEE